jgi:integrase
MELSCVGNAGDRNTFRTVAEFYLRHLAESATPKTLKIRQQLLAAFCKTEMADWPVYKLTPHIVRQWLGEMRQPRTVKYQVRGRTRQRTYQWGDGQVDFAVASLHAAMNFGVKERLISKNFLQGLSGPPARSRSRDCIVSPEDHQRILAAAHKQFREMIVCLENTGCRPGELLMATAADWNDHLGALVFYGQSRRRSGEGRHKTARKDRDRRIFFSGEALQIMRQRVQRYPQGPLWRCRQAPHRAIGSAALVDNFAELRKKIGLPNLTPYSYRHTFATRWLEAGRSIDDLAALLGNTPAVIRRHYAHLCDNLDRMRQLADSFTAARTDTSPHLLPFGKTAG